VKIDVLFQARGAWAYDGSVCIPQV
jgi:hypothetical protein